MQSRNRKPSEFNADSCKRVTVESIVDTAGLLLPMSENPKPSQDSSVDSEGDDDVGIPPEFPKSGISNQAHKIWIGNIDKRISIEQLLKIIRPYGKVSSLRYLFATPGRNPKEPRGYAFVEFSTRKEAETARVSLAGKKALRQKLSVAWARPDAAPSKLAESTSLTWSASQVTATLASNTSASAKIAALEQKLKSMSGQTPASMTPASKPSSCPPPSTLHRAPLLPTPTPTCTAQLHSTPAPTPPLYTASHPHSQQALKTRRHYTATSDSCSVPKRPKF